MIKIICVGKIKEKYWDMAIQEYIKRLSKYTKINLIEVDDCSIDDKNSSLDFEYKKMLNYIDKKDYIITLEIEGNQLSSEDFSKKINDVQLHYSNITFIIGGSYGINDKIKNISNYKLSFSKMTFPHQMFRVVLLEQIYRAYKILNNEKYHK